MSQLSRTAGTGALYELWAVRLTIAPGVAADFAGGHVTRVYGVEVGIGF